MNENDFDKLLTEVIPEAPPENIVKRVTPCGKALNRALLGIALCAVTFNFWGLQYILPTVGAVLMILGFRAARRENAGFCGCYVISVLRLISIFSLDIINATVYAYKLLNSEAYTVFIAVNAILTLMQLVFLLIGFRAAQKKARIPVHTGAAVLLIVWYTVMLALSSVNYEGVLVVIGVILSYIFIFINLFGLSAELSNAEYAFHASKTMISDRLISCILIITLFFGIASGYIFFGSFNMQWSESVVSEENENTEKIKEELLSLGFPENVLDDISSEDILECEGAKKVYTQSENYAVNHNGFTNENGYLSYKTRELTITGIAVELSEGEKTLKIFHHFLWKVNPGFCGTQCIQMWPAYRNSEGWEAFGDVGGRVLYEKAGKVFEAPFYTLGEESYSSNGFFTIGEIQTDIFAEMSFPGNGENCRGYLSYKIKERESGWAVISWINYTNQKSPVQYPVSTAKEKRRISGWSDAGVFHTIQDEFYFFADETE